MTTNLAGASPVDQPVMPLAPERAAFVAWMRDFANVADNYWMRDTKMGEHDAALSAWLHQQRRIDALRAAVAALLKCPSGEYCDAYPAALKLAQRAMNETEAPIASNARQATVATVTECEACFTPDACQLRGKCDHYAAEQLRIAKGRP